jgi:phosphate transport system protein
MDNMPLDNHIVSNFDEELQSIRDKTLTMGSTVLSQLEQSIKAIGDADDLLATKVINRESKVDDMEIDIDEACILIIVKRQPTASDLRFIMSVGRAVGDLERIGDEAKKIARQAIDLVENGASPKGYTEVRHIGKSVVTMLDHALTAFANLDAAAALEILKEDDQIDLDYKTALRELMTYMMEDPRSISRVMNVLWVIRSLERIGDHAKNLCEQVVFIVKGEDIRHA